MTFLPENYEPQKNIHNYMRFQNDENKIRILTKPIIGWEEWIERQPKRYTDKEKPTAWLDPKKPGKKFWAFEVWNYQEQEIQILHVRQKTIQDQIEKIVKDKDWGDPFYYDIKIFKEGKDLHTKYVITTGQKEATKEFIKEAFENKPCRLEALFTGDDPFGEWPSYTQGVFGPPVINTPETISRSQHQEIIDLIGDDVAYKDTLLKRLKKQFNIDYISELALDKYESVLQSVKINSEERLQKDLGELPEDLPF